MNEAATTLMRADCWLARQLVDDHTDFVLDALEQALYIPPAEAEANYYRQLRNAADVPALT